MSNSPNLGHAGAQQAGSGASEYNSLAFVMRQILSRVNTSMPVQVRAVTNTGGLAAVGFVDVQPLVNQIDGSGNSVPHDVVRHLPYSRMQGGANAVIIDPEVGDIGIVVFCSHDISTVASTRAQANPGTRRRFDMSDGVYLGGILGAAPTQYVQFSAAGIRIHSPTAIRIDAPSVRISGAIVDIAATSSTTVTTPVFTVNGATVLNGPLAQGTGTAGGGATMAGPVSVLADVTAGGKSLKSHTHKSNGSGAQTDPPT